MPTATSLPHIVFITWHDAGRWFGCYGNPCVRTPHVDRLAQEGCRFADFFAQSAICSPSRAAQFTGRYCQANGAMYLTNGPGDNRIHRGEWHLARWLKHHGYRTALAGVQHETCLEHSPEIHGFERREAHHPWPPGPVVAEAACGLLDTFATQGDRPFYLQLGLFEAHRPFDFHGCPPDDASGVHVPPYLADTAAVRGEIAAMQGMLLRGDAAIGRVLDRLDWLGLLDDTLVVMTVDHGVHLPRAKAHLYDAGIESSWLVRWPGGGVRPAHVVGGMASHVDVLPTLLDLVGLPHPPALHGLSFAEAARGDRDRAARTEHFAHMVETSRAIRTDRYKLIRNFNPPDGYAALPVDPAAPRHEADDHGKLADPLTWPFVELYDLATDPLEFVNRAGDAAFAEARDALDRRLFAFLSEHDDFILKRRPQTPWAAAAAADFLGVGAHADLE